MIYVCYHSSCYDGFGAAYAAWRKFGTSATYVPVTHGQSFPYLPGATKCYLLDFSYTRDIMEAVNKQVPLIVIDHHKTAQEALKGLPYAMFDLDRSGATLAWEYFHPGTPVPMFLAYLEDRDLWRFDLYKSKEVSAGLQIRPYDFVVWDDLVKSQGDGINRLITEGTIALAVKTQMVSQMADHERMNKIGGYTVPVANAACFFSEVAQELLRRHPECKFAAYYMDRGDGLRQYGMRSLADFDCSTVAKKYGGGGHPQAAGFTIPVPGDSLAG